MVRGRHRGLPMAIDRAVLLPGEELMLRMDGERGRRQEKGLETDREFEKMAPLAGAGGDSSLQFGRQRSKSLIGHSSSFWSDPSSSTNPFPISKWGGLMFM